MTKALSWSKIVIPGVLLVIPGQVYETRKPLFVRPIEGVTMPSPFAGMDPYLEYPPGWSNFHHWLFIGIAEAAAPLLRPHYIVNVEERVYLSVVHPLHSPLIPGATIPDVSVERTGSGGSSYSGGVATMTRPVEVQLPIPETVREIYLEFRDVWRDRELVTTLEVLSPTNKKSGVGREKYLRKRRAVLSSGVNLIEIDLLRAGERMPVLGAPDRYDYSVLVSRAPARSRADFYPVTVREPLPQFPLPLRPGEDEIPLDLGQVLTTAYGRGSFDLAVNYHLDPDPPLPAEEVAWADGALREKGLRAG